MVSVSGEGPANPGGPHRPADLARLANEKKHLMKTSSTLLLSALALGSFATLSIAQDAPPPGGPGGGPGNRPVPPLMAALDKNKDGVIDAEEIAAAAASLKTLDKNGDGKLTMEELRPARGERGPGGPGEGRPGGPGGGRPPGGAKPEVN